LSPESIYIWQQQLGYTSEQSSGEGGRKEVANGMRNLENGDVCDVCVKVKKSRESLSRPISHAF
jgi:hypothetical protein